MDVIETYSTALNLFKEKKLDEALTLTDELITYASAWKKPLLLKAYILREQGRLVDLFCYAEEILPLFDLSLPEEKDFASTTLNILGMACSRLSMPEVSAELLLQSAATGRNNTEACVEISNALFAANASEKFSVDDFQRIYDEYKKFLTDIEPFPQKIFVHKKIRVGFVSADFRHHPVVNWCFPLLTRLDKKFFATYCYSAGKKFDNVTEYLRSTADGWRDISDLTDEAAAKIIRDDEIDILVDLSGHTAGNRLRIAAYRPAAVQVSGVGYVNSTGLDCFDYFLSDKFCAGNESYFTETVIRLPHSHICYMPPPMPEILSAPCLRNGFVTFGCFNNYSKVTDSILSAWKKILDRVPQSRLLLKHKVFSTETDRNFIGERLKFFGFDLSRVEMRSFTLNYLDEYNDVDIALDTFPYTGGVTTCEALYMGVPVVSLYGERHGSRFGLSMLKNVGLDELAVENFDDYVERAVALAGDTELISILRKNLRGMMKRSPLMDAGKYVRDIEIVFAEILLAAQKNFCSP